MKPKRKETKDIITMKNRIVHPLQRTSIKKMARMSKSIQAAKLCVDIKYRCDVESHILLKQTVQCYLQEQRLQRNADIYSHWNCSPYPSLRKPVAPFLFKHQRSQRPLVRLVGKMCANLSYNLLGENAENYFFSL